MFNIIDEKTKKILVMSGKGGVGKTTIAINLAYALSLKGFKTGLLDVDISCPNVPNMLNIEDKKPEIKDNKLVPVELKTSKGSVYVISMAFLMKDNALIWRGPLKHKAIMQFINDVSWPELDYLVVDFPPGTGDEAISIAQMLKNSYSIIISTPQKVSLLDSKRSIDFSRKFNIEIIGLIENMSGNIFGSGTVKSFAQEHNLNFLAEIPLSKEITESSNKAMPLVMSNTETADKFNKIAEKIVNYKSTQAIQNTAD